MFVGLNSSLISFFNKKGLSKKYKKIKISSLVLLPRKNHPPNHPIYLVLIKTHFKSIYLSNTDTTYQPQESKELHAFSFDVNLYYKEYVHIKHSLKTTNDKKGEGYIKGKVLDTPNMRNCTP